VLKSRLDYNLKIRLPITAFVVVVTYIITFFVAKPERDNVGYEPNQPIPFSHKLHAGEMQIDCQYCHIGVEKGRHAVIPSVSTCMNCHSVARKDKPAIVQLTKYFNTNTPLPWKRIHKVPDYAYFNHSVHINKGISCQSCHGNVENMDKVSQVQKFTMGACLDCHRNAHQKLPELKGKINRGPDYCGACHR